MNEFSASSPTEATLSVNNLTDFSLYADAVAMAGRQDALTFVEILWDNYLHLDPDVIARSFEALAPRVALHVMWTGFVHTSAERLDRILDCMSTHIRALDPVYVSDHLLRTVAGDRYLAQPEDLDYEADLEQTCRRVQRYQEATGRRLLLENIASAGPQGVGQADFAGEVLRRTGAGLLFDVSNAIVAETNGGDPVHAWSSLLSQAPVHAHVGGYRLDPHDGKLRDSHGDPLSPASLDLVALLGRQGQLRSICLEREKEKTASDVADDLRRLNQALTRPPAETRPAPELRDV
ncbi:MAG: multinuclear nonheme iron-dependent oxidase [Nannocystales bacterium]